MTPFWVGTQANEYFNFKYILTDHIILMLAYCNTIIFQIWIQPFTPFHFSLRDPYLYQPQHTLTLKDVNQTLSRTIPKPWKPVISAWYGKWYEFLTISVFPHYKIRQWLHDTNVYSVINIRRLLITMWNDVNLQTEPIYLHDYMCT